MQNHDQGEEASLSVGKIFAEQGEAEEANARYAPPHNDVSYRPDLPDWGVYFRWPDNGDEWICDADLKHAERLLPSLRVFKRDEWDGEFYHLRYGEITIRVRPSMWTSVPSVDIGVGQQVELLERHGENDPGIFRIHDIWYSLTKQECEFTLGRNDMPLAKRFSRKDLRPIFVQHHLRSGFYEHAQPKSNLPNDLERLDVGDLLG